MKLLYFLTLIIFIFVLNYNPSLFCLYSGEEYEKFYNEYEYITRIKDRYELDSWITNNPDSPHIFLANRILEELHWRETFELDSLFAYNGYLKKYPNSYRKKTAERFRALAENTIEGYEEALKNVPDSRALKWHRDYLELTKAMEVNKKQAFIEFIEKYPDSEFNNTASYFINNVYK